MSMSQEVLVEILRDRRSALVGYASLFTGDRRDAEDLLHDAIVRTLAKPRTFTDVHGAESFVRHVIRSTFLDSARKSRTWRAKAHLFVVTDDATPSPDDTATAVMDVRAALTTLTARERACVVLRFFDDLTVPDIATELNLRAGTVKRYLSEGTAKLRLTLGEDLVHDDDTRAHLTTPTPGRSHA